VLMQLYRRLPTARFTKDSNTGLYKLATMLPWQRDTQEYDFNKRGAEKKFHAVGKVKMLVMNGA